VRAIANALGYIVAFWTTDPFRDTQDAGSFITRLIFLGTSLDSTKNTPAGQNAIIAKITGWFADTNGFISLQHDLNPWTIEIALAVIANITSAGATVASRIKTVGGCNNIVPNTRLDSWKFVDLAAVVGTTGVDDENSSATSLSVLSIFCVVAFIPCIFCCRRQFPPENVPPVTYKIIQK
jgi:hypothetical protein